MTELAANNLIKVERVETIDASECTESTIVTTLDESYNSQSSGGQVSEFFYINEQDRAKLKTKICRVIQRGHNN